jgi:hypothetical protein
MSVKKVDASFKLFSPQDKSAQHIFVLLKLKELSHEMDLAFDDIHGQF